jgi:TolA-binding protein
MKNKGLWITIGILSVLLVFALFTIASIALVTSGQDTKIAEFARINTELNRTVEMQQSNIADCTTQLQKQKDYQSKAEELQSQLDSCRTRIGDILTQTEQACKDICSKSLAELSAKDKQICADAMTQAGCTTTGSSSTNGFGSSLIDIMQNSYNTYK